MSQYIEEEIAKVEREVYGGSMPAHNRGVLRAMLHKKEEREDRFWQRWDARKDSNTGPDDQ